MGISSRVVKRCSQIIKQIESKFSLPKVKQTKGRSGRIFRPPVWGSRSSSSGLFFLCRCRCWRDSKFNASTCNVFMCVRYGSVFYLFNPFLLHLLVQYLPPTRFPTTHGGSSRKDTGRVKSAGNCSTIRWKRNKTEKRQRDEENLPTFHL